MSSLRNSKMARQLCNCQYHAVPLRSSKRMRPLISAARYDNAHPKIQSVAKQQVSFLSGRKSVITVLGIESSFDDCAIGIVRSDGTILADKRRSLERNERDTGGVNPMNAAEFHAKTLPGLVDAALEAADITMNEVDVIAGTVGPGLGPSLQAGLQFMKQLVPVSDKPFVAVHHMEAHLLTAGLVSQSFRSFPYLVIFMSCSTFFPTNGCCRPYLRPVGTVCCCMLKVWGITIYLDLASMMLLARLLIK
eukprot:m.85777 g.85777  ORF g.85777 m.85777 type:complete len:249 (+) comp13023_c0_seq3:49-795(+)